MFNRDKFNTLPYNRVDEVLEFVEGTANGTGIGESSANTKKLHSYWLKVQVSANLKHSLYHTP